ncbi:hypothetical protein P7K49_000629 [Saguinus oedipus]|uniref:Uncharacterized protein n=1 Tax=Saguinus oedipus TaxID=9490 RepID=A0ABQ9WER6_SAGOE|nr:hypothetical protein P7K49_000629 [Saguinus oedipus]
MSSLAEEKEVKEEDDFRPAQSAIKGREQGLRGTPVKPPRQRTTGAKAAAVPAAALAAQGPASSLALPGGRSAAAPSVAPHPPALLKCDTGAAERDLKPPGRRGAPCQI